MTTLVDLLHTVSKDHARPIRSSRPVECNQRYRVLLVIFRLCLHKFRAVRFHLVQFQTGSSLVIHLVSDSKRI